MVYEPVVAELIVSCLRRADDVGLTRVHSQLHVGTTRLVESPSIRS